MYRFLLILAIVFLMISCEKKTDWDLKENPEPKLVVDAIITNEFKVQTLTLNKSTLDYNQHPEKVSDANVIVSGNGEIHSFHELAGSPGTYVSNEVFAGTAGKEYNLQVTSSGNVYSAKASLLNVESDFEPLRYISSGNGLYQVSWVADAYSPLQPAMYEILLNWSAVPGYTQLDSVDTHARLYYYSLPTIDVSEIFAPTMESIKFPAGTAVVERKYALTAAHAEFVRAMLMETTWKGGFFNTAASGVPTNMSTGATGYFAACGVLSKTLVITGL